MAASGLQKIPATSFTNCTETLSYPAGLEHFSFLVSFSLLLGSSGEIRKEGLWKALHQLRILVDHRIL